MREHRGRSVAALLLLVASSARADGGALTLEAGVGIASLALKAPYAQSGANAWTLSLSTTLGLRYGVTHHLELSLTGFYDFPTEARHEGVLVPTLDSGTFSGTLRYDVSQFGAVAGIRYVVGLVARFLCGFEAGWSHRSYSGLELLDPTRPGAPAIDLGLQNFSADSLVLQPLAGLEWAFADHWSASLLARITVLIGPEPAFGASLVLAVSYGWFP